MRLIDKYKKHYIVMIVKILLLSIEIKNTQYILYIDVSIRTIIIFSLSGR